MTTWAPLLLLALVAAAAAVPVWPEAPLCSRECPVAAAKLHYQTNGTYVYSYSGKSRIEMKGVEGGITETEWNKQVSLTWLTPCDLAITIKVSNPQGPADRFVEKYPLLVAVSDGRLQHVCAHPDDDGWAINIKKGIAAMFQNSLPALTETSSGINFTETDVAGRCPTRYEVEAEGEKRVVRKEKNHRLCDHRFPTPSRTDLPWLKTPLPMEESHSRCTQEITNGIYTSIQCEDWNKVRPSYGVYKHVEARQESTLRYQSQSSQQPPAISTITGHRLVNKDLYFDFQAAKKDPSLVTQLEQRLSEICHKSQEVVEPEVGPLVAEVVRLMRQVPDEKIHETLTKIRQGQISGCPNYRKLESLFLDAVAFVNEAGAIKVMAEEMKSGRVSGGRSALYTLALYMHPRPDAQTLDHLQDLIQSDNIPSSTKLAVGTLVNTYCRNNSRCHEEAPVRSVAQALKGKIQCSASDEETQEKTLASLKALGNMGVMTPEVASSVLSCLENESAKTNIRVAAVQAFRQSQCHRQTTERLIRIATDTKVPNTEVRIGSYLMAVRCAEYKDFFEIVANISSESNTQVRGFILSHLLNLQQSDAPEKQNLRYNLTNIVIPQDFERDLRKYSRNLDLSYYAPSLGLGAGLESNIIFSPGSFVPRSMDLNLTSAFQGIPINFAQLGARVEGLDPVLANIFGPEGYLTKTSYNKIYEDVAVFMGEKWGKILTEVQQSIRQRRSIDFSSLRSLLSKLGGEELSGQTQAELFARFLGQELTFFSKTGDLKNLDTDAMIHRFFEYLREILPNLQNLDLNSARTMQMRLDYYFPTIQGTPLKMEMEATTVLGLKMEGSLEQLFSNWDNSEKHLKIIPSISTEVSGFIGYDSYLHRAGIKTNTTVSSNGGGSIKVTTRNSKELEIELDLPQKMELLNVTSETYLMKKSKNSPETRINPSSMRDIRTKFNNCLSSMESWLGIKWCIEADVPDVFRHNALPFGSPAKGKIFVEKSESITGYKMKLSSMTEGQSCVVEGEVEALGSSPPRKASVMAGYKSQDDVYSVVAQVKSSSVETEFDAKMINRNQGKGFEVFGKLKTNNYDFARGIKIDYKYTSGNEKNFELEVFSSRSEQFPENSKVLDMNYKWNTNERRASVGIKAKSDEALRSYVDFDMDIAAEVKFDSRLSIPEVCFPKMQIKFHGKYSEWEVNSAIQQSPGTSRTSYTSSFKLSRQQQALVDVEASTSVQGRFVDYNFVTTTSLQAKVGRCQYKSHQELRYTTSQTALIWQLMNSIDSRKIIDVEISYQGQLVKMNVEAPEYMKLMAEIRHQSEGQYQTHVTLAVGRDQQPLLQLTGPVTIKQEQFSTELTITTPKNSQNRVVLSTSIVNGQKKHEFMLKLSNQQSQIFNLEWHMKGSSGEGVQLQGQIYLPKLVDGKLSAIISSRVVHIAPNVVLMPDTNSARRLKGYTDSDLDNNKHQFEVSWDADRNPNEKIKGELTVSPTGSSPGTGTILGSVTVKGEQYRINMQVEAADILHRYTGHNSIILQVTNPSQRSWRLQTRTQVAAEASSADIQASIQFKSLSDKTYKYETRMQGKTLGEPYNYQVDAQMTLTPSDAQPTTVSAEFKHESSMERNTLYSKVRMSSPYISRPIVIEWSTVNQETSYITEIKSEINSPMELFKWQLEITPEGGVRKLDVGVDLRPVEELMKEVEQMLGSGSVQLGNSRNKAYRVLYSRPYDTKHSIMVKYPSRTVEGEVHHSPMEYSVKFTPNSQESQAMYEVGIKATHNYWDQGSKYEGSIRHPSMSREMTAMVHYSGTSQTWQGTFELDIFPDIDDKITADLRSNLTANNTIRVEANLAMKALKFTPRVIVETAWAPRTMGFNFTVQETPSSPVSFKAYAKYDRISERNAVVSMFLMTEGRVVLDISGSIKPEEVAECNGFRTEGRVRTSAIGSFDVLSLVCRPAFIKLVTKRDNSNTEAITKVGLQLPKNLEFSISTSDILEVRKDPAFMAKLQLLTPTYLKIDVARDSQQTESVKEFVSDEWQKVWEACSSWSSRFYDYLQQKARESGRTFPSSELSNLCQRIREEMRQIYQDLKTDMERMRHSIVSEQFIEYMKEIYSWIWDKLTQVQQEWIRKIVDAIKNWKQECRTMTEPIMKSVEQICRWVETGEEPEFVQQIKDFLDRCEIVRLMRAHILEPVRQQYPEQYQAAMEVVTKIRTTMASDIYRMHQQLRMYPQLERVVLRIKNTIDSEEKFDEEVAQLLIHVIQRFMVAGVELDAHHIGFQIPLHEPAYSLTQLAKKMMFSPPSMTEKLITSVDRFLTINPVMASYYSWVPRNFTNLELLMPYNATALIVGNTEIKTWDGARLRTNTSSCKVLLAAWPNSKLDMINEQPSAPPRIIFSQTSPKVEVDIKRDLRVTINGREVSDSQTVGGVTVHKMAQRVVLESQLMWVQVLQQERVVMMNASGWTMGQMVGLLGSYDGEKANDWTMKDGRNASNPQELVRSWQEDQQCQTPDIRPIDYNSISFKREVECVARMTSMKPCYPVIPHKVFLDKCLTGENTCEGTFAYRSTCQREGVMFPLSIPCTC